VKTGAGAQGRHYYGPRAGLPAGAHLLEGLTVWSDRSGRGRMRPQAYVFTEPAQGRAGFGPVVGEPSRGSARLGPGKL